MSVFFRKIIQAILKHPVIALLGLLAVVVLIVVLSSSNKTTPEPQAPVAQNPPTDTAPIQPADPLPGGDAGGGGDNNNPSIDPEAPDNSEEQPVRDLNGDIVPQEFIPAPDIHDTDPETQAQTEELLRSAPAFQKLPLQKNGVYADLEDILPDGRMVIVVKYSRTLNQAETVWNNFLKINKDRGTSYLVLYRR